MRVGRGALSEPSGKSEQWLKCVERVAAPPDFSFALRRFHDRAIRVAGPLVPRRSIQRKRALQDQERHPNSRTQSGCWRPWLSRSTARSRRTMRRVAQSTRWWRRGRGVDRPRPLRPIKRTKAAAIWARRHHVSSVHVAYRKNRDLRDGLFANRERCGPQLSSFVKGCSQGRQAQTLRTTHHTSFRGRIVPSRPLKTLVFARTLNGPWLAITSGTPSPFTSRD